MIELLFFKRFIVFVIVAVVVAMGSEEETESSDKLLTSLPELDELLSANTTTYVQRDNNVDVIHDATSNETMGICNLAYLISFSYFPDGTTREPFSRRGSLESVAALTLAVQHLNTGDGSVIPEIKKELMTKDTTTPPTNSNENNNEKQHQQRSCPIKFTAELFDTERQAKTSVNEVIKILERTSNNDLLPLSTTTKNEKNYNRLPCAFLGAGSSANTKPTAIVTGLNGYPQFSPISTSTQLDDRSQFGLFGRLIPSDDGTAVPLTLYLYSTLNVKRLVRWIIFLVLLFCWLLVLLTVTFPKLTSKILFYSLLYEIEGVIFVNNGFGNAYASSITRAVSLLTNNIMDVQAIDVPTDANDKDVQAAIRFLKSTKYRYFFAIIPNKMYDRIMMEAYEQQIVGSGEHTWIFADSIGSSTITGRTYVRNSPLHLASRGVGRLSARAGVKGMDTYDRFVKAWKSLNNKHDIEYIESLLPTYPNEPAYEPERIKDDRYDDFFDNPGTTATFLYDTTVALGLAACKSITKTPTNTSYFDGQTHFDAVFKTKFVGATGNIVLDAETGSRDPTSAIFQLLNFVEIDAHDGSNNISFTAITSQIFDDGVWAEKQPFVYNDNTTEAHNDLPEVTEEKNFIGIGLRVAGFALSGLIIIQSLAFAYWTFHYRNVHVVKASQPIFLFIICSGVGLMGIALIPYTFDDEMFDTNSRVLDVSCMATWWFFATGFAVAFSALFSKTYRINKLYHNASRFKRIKITAWDVMKPMIALLSINIIILTLWTIISPLKFTRRVTDIDPFDRAIESIGNCDSEGYLPFAVTLAVIDGCAIVFSIYQSWHARNISTEYSESEYIAMAMGTIMIVSVIAVPILIIVNDEPKAEYFVSVSIMFVLAYSLLCYIFIPKILNKNKRSPLRRKYSYKKQPRKRSSLMQFLTFGGFKKAKKDDTASSEQDDVSDEIERTAFRVSAASVQNGTSTGFRISDDDVDVNATSIESTVSSLNESTGEIGLKIYNNEQLVDELREEIETLKNDNYELKNDNYELRCLIENDEPEDPYKCAELANTIDTKAGEIQQQKQQEEEVFWT